MLAPDQRLLATLKGGSPDAAVVTLMSVGPARLRQLSSFEGGIAVAVARRPPGGHVRYRREAALWMSPGPTIRPCWRYSGPAPPDPLWGEAFSPDGKLLAAARRQHGPVRPRPPGPAAVADRAERPRRPDNPRRHRVFPDGRLLALATATAGSPSQTWPAGPRRPGHDRHGPGRLFPGAGVLAARRPVRGDHGRHGAGVRLGGPGRPALTAAAPDSRRGPCTRAGSGPRPGWRGAPPAHGPLVRARLRSRRPRPDRHTDKILPTTPPGAAFTWQPTASGRLAGGASAGRDAWDGRPALARTAAPSSTARLSAAPRYACGSCQPRRAAIAHPAMPLYRLRDN